MSIPIRIGLLPPRFIMPLVVALAVVLISADSRPAAGQDDGSHVNEFSQDIENLEQMDAANPPPKGAILFTGSSIFVQWKELRLQMDPLPVFNRAFGGSRTWELLHYIDRVVLPYKPAVIVCYCGSNDINAGEPPLQISQRIRRFAEAVHTSLPKTRIVYVSIIKAPQKMSHWDFVEKTNREISDFCTATNYMTYVDVNRMFFKKLGQPRMEVFQPDGLHLIPAAYDELTVLVRPAVEKAWKAVSREAGKKSQRELR